MSPRALVEQLAESHDAHLRWLRGRLGRRLADDEYEDVLQAAYARALTSLAAPAGRRADLSEFDHAVAWLRTVALNLARDVGRERHGRHGVGRNPRQPPVALDQSWAERLAADVDVEEEVLHAVERQARAAVVVKAIAGLDPRHRQVLQLRYGRDLDPAAVMVLIGLDRRQWDGRHTRALKALGRALARLHVSRECGRTRLLLRKAPASLLMPGGEAGDHIASCVPCAAFSAAARFAIVSLPLPLAIPAWRLDALDVLAGPSSRPQPTQDGDASAFLDATTGGQAKVSAGLSAAAGGLVAAGAVVVAGGLALIGLGADGVGHAMPEHTKPRGTVSRGSVVGTTGTRLAVHHTRRQALERSAREMARRRRQAASRDDSSGRGPDSLSATAP